MSHVVAAALGSSQFQIHQHSFEGNFPLGRIFPAERNFLLFEQQLAKSSHQKTKEIIVPCEKFHWEKS